MARREPCQSEEPFNCPHCGKHLGKTNGSEICICGVIFRDATKLTCMSCLREYDWHPVAHAPGRVRRLMGGGLRPFGIYTLPDGTEVVAAPNEMDGHFLYPPEDWQFFPRAPAAYETYQSGLIRRRGKLTGWHVSQLIDTGRTFEWYAKSTGK